ncbi:hypothetical protein Pint_07275 [Pistacia integerrima]|uniref:Uncharacterized protein n=1 Tax=Pistacia integerrima TaxID=434235 RepID=A0ACC0XZR5_9ROSI|nr:hypothetical protein Pint_07275 [Pistacia integerrima]
MTDQINFIVESTEMLYRNCSTVRRVDIHLVELAFDRFLISLSTHSFHWYFTSALLHYLLVAYPLCILGFLLDRRVLHFIFPVSSFVLPLSFLTRSFDLLLVQYQFSTYQQQLQHVCHLIHLLEENCTMPFWLCSVLRDVLNHVIGCHVFSQPQVTSFMRHFTFFVYINRKKSIWKVLSIILLGLLMNLHQIKSKDLTERETPMDCLIFGDVGFGKTKVALRAIFCVVSAGKQAMVLAPTIVLAKQHFDVISERFSIYPNVNVGLLSRFQTKAEKEEYLDMIKQGHLNIIMGTHSLLGSCVVFNNLGLPVVDKEQRFGVKQKEKIAPFKTSVDVLTLSATPIPRTLYLALTGFCDACLISTPPPERVPIKTHLSAFSKEKVISAVKNELDQDGQVFYVLPRIKGLEEVMDFLEQAFPNVDIAIAHG